MSKSCFSNLHAHLLKCYYMKQRLFYKLIISIVMKIFKSIMLANENQLKACLHNCLVQFKKELWNFSDSFLSNSYACLWK